MSEQTSRAVILLVLLVGMGAYKIRAPGSAEAAVGDRAAGDASWLPAPATLAVMTAEHYVGTPYRWAGDSPAEGFDCSGFVQHVYGLNGIGLPRVSRDQALAGRAIPTDPGGLRMGDLLFFGDGGVVDHVAIYAGDGAIIHADSERGVVAFARLADRTRQGRPMLAARRVVPRAAATW